ncbi:MAG TPA: flagellar hook-associated protein FlgK, partial [Candidatus Polarisedimenticolia bacterium]|nr:flagellar hook-associated protein FlgK [Candidatus Polarisedimenticolia bacterium]
MNLFGYFDLGRRAMDAARLGLQVAGDNISNASTPGYARRRLDLVPGPVIQVPGGWLDQGVEVGAIRRMEDRFLQANLEREKGGLGEADERLRGLKEIEAIFGSLDGNGIASALAGFTASFNALAGQADSLGARRAALSAADTLAGALRDTSARLQTQRGLLDKSVEGSVAEINRLAGELAGLNREIALEEADGTVAAPLRDRRAQVIESLGDLTGGAAYAGPGGRLLFALPSGVTLVSGDNALPLGTARAANGTLRILSG